MCARIAPSPDGMLIECFDGNGNVLVSRPSGATPPAASASFYRNPIVIGAVIVLGLGLVYFKTRKRKQS